eukprot:gene15055-biopygen949
MPRHLRYFTWRLMHAALPVGAARVKFIRAGNVEQLKQQCCQHPTCQALQPQPPLGDPVPRVCPVPSRAAGLVLVASHVASVGPSSRPHAPGAALAAARCSAAGSPSHTAQSVVGRFVAAVKHQAALDWQRVCSDIRWNTGLPFSWFKGRDPSIQAAAFRDKWCTRGVVASWQPPTAASPRGSYAFRLSAAGV